LLVAGWSLLFFGESLGALAWTGIAISVLGLVAMALMARGNDESKALPWTLLAMLAMTGRLRRSTGRWMPRARPGAMALLVGSLCVGLAYALVIQFEHQVAVVQSLLGRAAPQYLVGDPEAQRHVVALH
jgi:drug/metabolite transporter (DMT)-like permease